MGIPCLGSGRKDRVREEEFREVHIGTDAELNARYKGNFVRTTRYTVVNFVPKNLFEQLHRLANVYFLIIALLQVFTNLSPTGRYTTIGPLFIILSVSALKDAIEDYARYKSDVETNNRPLHILTNGDWEKKPWKELRVGDLVKIHNREFFPADLLILCSSESLGMAYIETSNLDGETNLKIRQALLETNEQLLDPNKTGDQEFHTVETEDLEELNKFQAVIRCEPPNNRLNDFEGTLDLHGQKFSLTNQQILLRGAQLRQTKWAIGVVVFSGYDTKVVMNSTKAPTKRSNIERRTNHFIVVILTIMILLVLTASFATVAWGDDKMDEAWYLPASSGKTTAFFESFGTYLILLSTMVPISLYVTLEIVKMFQAFHINWDLDMLDLESNTFAVARSSGLNEELGQVEYIFSDKTGTLTKNLMEFRKCTVGKISYGKGTTEIGKAAALRAGRVVEDDLDEDWQKPDPMFNFRDPALLENLNDDEHPDAGNIREFLTLLAVCHTVIPEGSGEKLVYQAASPDEAALVAGAKCLGFKFHTRTPKEMVVEVQGQDEKFELLNILEFNSDRKRMSVIVKQGDRVVLYCKGADTKIYERMSPNQPHANITLKHLEQFAGEGLRTLCCASREIEYSEWQAWNEEYQEAATSLTNRQQMLDDVAEKIETNLTLIGTTAIEDKLQDGVPDCIATLARANIKIWVLTGDKQETAINIGFACALLTDQMVLLILNEPDADSTRRAMKEKWEEYQRLNEEERKFVAIIVDGKTLEHILEDLPTKMSFLELGKRSKAVVCCRVTPKQKADVTTLVKVHDGRICLAIGDGANDVAMIQAAHVGVGISGKEGLQAVQSSDYAIAQFRFLKKLLLVHGHWNYRRISRVITFNFYKNMTLYMTQFWFGLYNIVSGQSLYEAWTQSAFNVFFTFLPIVAYGILDQDVSAVGLFEFPSIYRVGQDKLLFNARMFAYWLSTAFYHSVICFIIPLFLFVSLVAEDGQSRGLYSMGLYTYTGVVYVVSGKVLLMTRTHNFIIGMSIFLSILAWFMWLTIYSFIILDPNDQTGVQLGYAVLDLPSWWLTTVLILVAALGRDFSWRGYKDCFLTSDAVHANFIIKYNRWDDVQSLRNAKEAERAAAARTKQSPDDGDRRKSTISTLRKCNSGLGFAFAASDRDPKHGETDWEQRLKKVLHSDETKKKKQKRKSNASPL